MVSRAKQQRVRALRREMGWADAARKMGVTVQTARRYYYGDREKGAPLRRRHNRADQALVADLRAAGVSWPKLQAMTGIPQSTMRRWVRQGRVSRPADVEYCGYVLHSRSALLSEFRHRPRDMAVFEVGGRYIIVPPDSADYDCFVADSGCDWIGVYSAVADLHTVRGDLDAGSAQ